MSHCGSAYLALDEALAILAEREYERLARRIPVKDQIPRLAGTFEQFAGMANGTVEPTFTDPWTALFYLLWYQPSQISLFHAVFADLLGSGICDDRSQIFNGKLQIADFGCGSFAAQFGLALACMELRDHQMIPDLAVTNIDKSREMTMLGRDLCTEWERQLSTLGLQHLADTSAMISSKVAHHRIERVTNVNPKATRCLVASNVIFPSNLTDVIEQLACLWCDMEPHRAIIAMIPSRTPANCIEEAFVGSQWISPPSAPMYRQSGKAHRLSEWRQSLLKRLEPSSEYSIISGYLKSDVLWDKDSPVKIGILAPAKCDLD